MDESGNHLVLDDRRNSQRLVSRHRHRRPVGRVDCISFLTIQKHRLHVRQVSHAKLHKLLGSQVT